MKRIILPIIIVLFLLQSFLLPFHARAATTTTTAATTSASTDGTWVPDSDVTFLGKTASRSALLLNWTLTNYKWAYDDSALVTFWSKIRNIIYVIILLVVLGSAFVLIVTGGSNPSTLIFLRKFVIALLLITFSFALLRFLYQITDIVQSFFIHNPDGSVISSRDLLNISFDYTNFLGFRRIGPSYEESAFISLLLVRLTAITYYIMAGILLVRKIILWFFIAVSPLYPLILLYMPLRNTAKIWIAEFFRWLLYAPLFAILLSSLVVLWRNNIMILPFNFGQHANVYPTAINILLGGPGQQLAIDNSVNYNDTFAQYIVALIMLWVVILLPFVLLQILLDYISKVPFDRTRTTNYIDNLMKKLPGGFTFSGKPSIAPVPQPPMGNQPAGIAKALPISFSAKSNNTHNISSQINHMHETNSSSTNYTNNVSHNTLSNNMRTTNQAFSPSHTQNVTNTSQVGKHTAQTPTRLEHPTIAGNITSHITTAIKHNSMLRLRPEIASKESLRLTNLPVPTMIDIVRFETAKLTKQQTTTQEAEKVNDTLKQIAKPETSPTTQEQQQYSMVKQKLSEAKTQGDPLARSILNAASATTGQNQQTLVFPVVNKVQTVSVDDYETVRQMWEENYEHMEVPTTQKSREAWIQDDEQTIEQTITLLNSTDPQQLQKGMAAVSHILPFLLIGGFSQAEVITYLKAKVAAGKAVLKTLKGKQNEEDTLLDLQQKTQHEEKHQTATAALPLDADDKVSVDGHITKLKE